MPIVGLHLLKYDCEKKEFQKGQISVKNNITLKDITITKLELGNDKQKTASFYFVFSSLFEPKMGNITIEGEVLYLDEESKLNDLIAEWKKTKKLPPEVMTSILNHALAKCNVKALVMSEDLGLPYPVPLPQVNTNKKETAATSGDYIG